jgi:two-component system, response regulator PdtaR
VSRRFPHEFRLLIADDDAGFRETVQEILAPRFETVSVDSGEAAIDIVRTSPVHLILTDEHMPVLGGVETVSIVRSIRADLPCILMTADLTDDLRRRAELIRFYAVLEKPPHPQRLLQTVENALIECYSASA